MNIKENELVVVFTMEDIVEYVKEKLNRDLSGFYVDDVACNEDDGVDITMRP